MIKLGIRAHDIGKMNAVVLSQKVDELGFMGVQLVINKALSDVSDLNQIDVIKEAFPHNIMMLGAYFNPVHPNRNEVEKGIDNFKKHLEIAPLLNAKYVGTETGSLMGSPWGYVKENHDYNTLNSVITIVDDLVKYAEKNQTTIAIEGAYAHVAYRPKEIKHIIDHINSKHLKVTIDLFNFLHLGNYEDRNIIFEECIKLLKKDIVIFHLKDFVISNNELKQVGLGQGLMDYPWMIKQIKENFEDVFLIFEGVVHDDIKTSFEYISNLLIKE